MASKGKVSIIGGGLIGQSWAMIFLSAGYNVNVYDKESERTISAVNSITKQLNNFEAKGILRGNLTAKKQIDLIAASTDLSECVKDAFWVQECVFEDLQLKREIFSELDMLVSSNAILASSTSFIQPSKFLGHLKNRANALVNHPVNPPYFALLTELVPSKWTKPETISRAKKILSDLGQRPVVLKKEIDGFIINRLQDAIFAEAYSLIDDGVIDVDDLDAVMSEGLGMRYAFMGPWETAHLNANGMVEYFEKYAQGIYDVQKSFKAPTKMEGDTAKKIIDSMLKKVPMEKLVDRRKWRDEMMAKLAQIKK